MLHNFGYFNDYVIGSSFQALRADMRGNGGINARDVKIPTTFSRAMASRYAKQWKEAMDMEMAALKDKGVLEMIPKCEMPSGSKAVKTMWVSISKRTI